MRRQPASAHLHLGAEPETAGVRMGGGKCHPVLYPGLFSPTECEPCWMGHQKSLGQFLNPQGGHARVGLKSESLGSLSFYFLNKPLRGRYQVSGKAQCTGLSQYSVPLWKRHHRPISWSSALLLWTGITTGWPCFSKTVFMAPSSEFHGVSTAQVFLLKIIHLFVE